MSNEVADLLRRARARIERPEAWAAGEYCLDAGDKPCRYGEAIRFCAIGAIEADREPFKIVARELLSRAAGVRKHLLAVWNDAEGRTHAEVLAAFDRAIALAESPPPDGGRDG